jgi:hypothetical protein
MGSGGVTEQDLQTSGSELKPILRRFAQKNPVRLTPRRRSLGSLDVAAAGLSGLVCATI